MSVLLAEDGQEETEREQAHEEETLRENVQTDIAGALSPEAFISVLQSVPTVQYGACPETWRDIVTWCESCPQLAYVIRGVICHTTTVESICEYLHLDIGRRLVSTRYPKDNDSDNKHCYPRLEPTRESTTSAYHIYGTPQDLKDLYSRVVANHSAQHKVGDFVGMGPIPENVSGLGGIFHGFIVREVVDYSLHNTVTPFFLHVVKGLGDYPASVFTEELIAHNRAAHQRYVPHGKKYIMTQTGWVAWDFDHFNPSDLPIDTVTLPQSYMPAFIGKKGTRIKSFNARHKIAHGGINVVSLPDSPQLPAIVCAPYALSPEQHVAIKEYIAKVADMVLGSYDEYDDWW